MKHFEMKRYEFCLYFGNSVLHAGEIGDLEDVWMALEDRLHEFGGSWIAMGSMFECTPMQIAPRGAFR